MDSTPAVPSAPQHSRLEPSASPSREYKETCIFWYHGTCRRGADCVYEHELNHNWPISRPKQYTHEKRCELKFCPLRTDMVEMMTRYYPVALDDGAQDSVAQEDKMDIDEVVEKSFNGEVNGDDASSSSEFDSGSVSGLSDDVDEDDGASSHEFVARSVRTHGRDEHSGSDSSDQEGGEPSGEPIADSPLASPHGTAELASSSASSFTSTLPGSPQASLDEEPVPPDTIDAGSAQVAEQGKGGNRRKTRRAGRGRKKSNRLPPTDASRPNEANPAIGTPAGSHSLRTPGALQTPHNEEFVPLSVDEVGTAHGAGNAKKKHRAGRKRRQAIEEFQASFDPDAMQLDHDTSTVEPPKDELSQAGLQTDRGNRGGRPHQASPQTGTTQPDSDPAAGVPNPENKPMTKTLRRKLRRESRKQLATRSKSPLTPSPPRPPRVRLPQPSAHYAHKRSPKRKPSHHGNAPANKRPRVQLSTEPARPRAPALPRHRPPTMPHPRQSRHDPAPQPIFGARNAAVAPSQAPKAPRNGPGICFFWYHRASCNGGVSAFGCPYLHEIVPGQKVSWPLGIGQHNPRCALPLCPIASSRKVPLGHGRAGKN